MKLISLAIVLLALLGCSEQTAATSTLISCPSCGRQISQDAASCPQCGYDPERAAARLEGSAETQAFLKELETKGRWKSATGPEWDELKAVAVKARPSVDAAFAKHGFLPTLEQAGIGALLDPYHVPLVLRVGRKSKNAYWITSKGPDREWCTWDDANFEFYVGNVKIQQVHVGDLESEHLFD